VKNKKETNMKTITKKQRLKPADTGLFLLFAAIVVCIALLIFSETAEAAPATEEPTIVAHETTEPEIIYEVVYVDRLEFRDPADYQELLAEHEDRLQTDAKYQAALQEFIAEKIKESPYKFYTYTYLRSKGYSKAVTCGIIGNMMCECGKNNDLRPTILGKDNRGREYYGVCQWAVRYNPTIKGMSLEEQLDYLTDSYIKVTFKDYYKNSKKGWQYYYDQFLACTSCEGAAEIFAEVCERPSSTNYSKRALEALRTFEQFTFTYTEDIYFAAE